LWPMASALILGGPAQHSGGLRRCHRALTMAHQHNLIARADAQREAYFSLLPWEKKPTFDLGGRPTTLDLRAFIQPFNRGSAVRAAVFARQTGAAAQWRIVGDVGALDEAAITTAVANQRDIINAWARAFYTDFETDERLLRLDAPIQLGWAIQSKAKGKQAEWMHEVPLDTPMDETVRCGFRGSPSRPVKGGGVTPRLVKIELTTRDA